MPEKEYLIFCDESEQSGRYYSNFYGGVLVGGSQHKKVSDRLNAKKRALNLFGEIKWRKVSERYLPKYEAMMASFFDEVRAGHVKVRIMFTQNAHEPRGLSEEHVDLRYFLLYYQFIKHGFGLAHLDNAGQDFFLRLYFDRIPDTAERAAQFKGHLHALQETHRLKKAKVRIRENDVTEVSSHDHVLLQCIDVVLGAVAFRLNGRHKAKIPGTRRRGKKTVAKERLYKTILSEVKRIKPGFNIGITTGLKGDAARLWDDPYRHWCFRSKDSEYRRSRTKRGQKKSPA